MPGAYAKSASGPISSPRIDDILPAAALPGGEVELTGANLGPSVGPPALLPTVFVDAQPAQVLMSRPTRLAFHVPEDAATGLIQVSNPRGLSNTAPLRVAHQLSDGLHPVTSPAVSRSGMIYATISGARGKQTPVSVVRVSPDGRGTPFVTGILNPTGLAFSPEGELFVTSRAEGMGVATGAVFDIEGNLFVGDRSGTIFKINPDRQIFVYATLEPSVSAYHLAVDAAGTLYVTGPTLSSNDAIWAIDTHGDARVWYSGLGRPQGLALSKEGDIYLTACLHGRCGVVRVTPQGEATLVLSGTNLVGLAFSPLGTAILSTSDAVYDVDLGVEGLNLF